MITSALIRALLEENSVTITGLGTFYVKKLSAQVKEEIIYPPQNIIEFEFGKEVEGFDFVSKLSKWEQIRMDEAQTQISEWINLLEKGLKYNKSVFFDDFGTFLKDTSGKIVFKGVINSQLNVENEGFDPVLISYKMHKGKKQAIEKSLVDKRVAFKKKKKKRDRLWFVLTIFIALVTLSALFMKDTLRNYRAFMKNEKNAASKDVENETTADISGVREAEANDFVINNEKNLHTDEILNDVVPEKSSEKLNKNEDKDKPEVTPPKPSKSNDLYMHYQKGKYYVIAGSFMNEKDALRHIREKKLEKYGAKLIVHPDNPRVRVSIGVFDNEKDAYDFAVQIDKNYWVLK